MVTWMTFADADPEMAGAGQKLLAQGIAYLATTRKDGAPRVHPVTPVLADGRLYVAIPPSSPKGHDLRRDGRYALHALPGKVDDEFMVAGRARVAEDAATRDTVRAAANHAIHDDDVLFEFRFDRALWGWWENVGQPNTRPVRRWWRAGEATPSY